MLSSYLYIIFARIPYLFTYNPSLKSFSFFLISQNFISFIIIPFFMLHLLLFSQFPFILLPQIFKYYSHPFQSLSSSLTIFTLHHSLPPCTHLYPILSLFSSLHVQFYPYITFFSLSSLLCVLNSVSVPSGWVFGFYAFTNTPLHDNTSQHCQVQPGQGTAKCTFTPAA